MPDTRILLLGDPDGDLAHALARPGVVLTVAPDADEAVRLAADAEVVVLDVSGAFKSIAEVCHAIRSAPELTSIPILCASTSDDVEERILLLEAGADDVIARPFDVRELEARIEALHLRFERSKELTPISTTPVETTRRSGKRAVLLYSPKGGVGTTTLAVNLAVTLARRAPDQVAILDLATPLGHVATHLNLNPRQTLADVVRDPSALREPELLRSAAEHHVSGLHVFAAHGVPAPGPVVPVTQLETLFDTAMRAYRTVVIDGGSGLDDGVRWLLAHADDVVLVFTPDFPAIKAVHGLLEFLEGDGAVLASPTFVLNEPWARELLRQADIEEALGSKISARIPFDAFIYLRAVNEGVPVVALAPKSAPSERIERLASVILGEEDPDASDGMNRSRGLAGLFRRG